MAQTLEHNGSVTQVVPVDIPFCDVDVEVIQKLDDEPNDVGGLSAQELKERFDHVGAELKGYLNEKLIPTVVSDDLTEQTRQEAEAERVKNERERVGNETGRTKAEAARVSAEEARATAETARAGAEGNRENAERAREAAEAARAAAEEARTAAETARTTAEAGRATAEIARVSAEEARATAETARAGAEGNRESAETERATAEAARVSGEEARATAETARAGAEGNRENAERAREAAEAARVSAEEARTAAETARAGAEGSRESAEEARAQAEAARAAAETARAEAEARRGSAETQRQTAEEERAAAEAQRADTDAGIVAQATAQAALAGEKAQSAAESAQAAAGSRTAAEAAAGEAAESAGAAAESRENALTAKTGAEAAQALAEAAKAGAETAKAAAQAAQTQTEGYAQQAGEAAQGAAALAAQAEASAALSASEADRAKLEADRAKAISEGDFVTPVELAEAVKVKAEIPLVGTEEELEELPAGGILLITDTGGGEMAKARQIGVKDKDGVVQVVELGGSGGKRVNGGELLKEIQIANVSTCVKPWGELMSWEDISGLVANTELSPTEAEKEMFKAEDGSYTLKRIVYDGYLSTAQATGNVGLVIKAVSTDETGKVTIYDKNWLGITNNGNNGAAQAHYAMHPNASVYFRPFRDGMDNMKLAAQSTPMDYDAQQRVYIDVEAEDGSAVDHYVLVLRLARDYNNNMGLYDYKELAVGSNGKTIRGKKFPDRVKAEGTAPAKPTTHAEYAIWVYPDWADLSVCPPNGEVTLWSDEVQEKIDAGDTGDLLKDQIDMVTKYGAVDEWGHSYPLAFRVGVPCCEMLHIKILAENPLSAVGYAGDNAKSLARPKITNWTEGGIDAYYDCAAYGEMGKNLQLYAGVRTQLKNMTSSAENSCRGFIISVEAEPAETAELTVGNGASITFPAGTGERVYTISDGTDVKSSRTKTGKLFVVLRHCNATYEARVTVGGKTYAGQIVTGAYYGECTLDADGWTEVTEE